MKRIFTITFFFISSFSFSQTNCDSLTTTYTVTSTQSFGTMFSVVAKSAITLNSFYANLAPGTNYYSIFYKKGSYFGYETSPQVWTLIDSALASSNNLSGKGIPTKIPININLNLVKGDTISLYIENPKKQLIYNSGTVFNGVDHLEKQEYVSDTALSILVGVPINYFFTFNNINTRVKGKIWNGTINYCATIPVSLSEKNDNKYAFNVVNSQNELLIQLSSNLLGENKNIQLCLYDILSRPILTEKIYNSEKIINTAFVSKGVYICTVSDNQHIIKLKKIIIE